MPRTSRGRTDRMPIPCTPEEKVFIKDAAEFGGEDVASFVRRAAITEARRLLAPRVPDPPGTLPPPKKRAKKGGAT